MKLAQLDSEIYLIHDFIHLKNCEALIMRSERIGYTNADVQVNAEKRQHLNLIRNNQRVNDENQTLADEWWQRLSLLDLPTFADKHASGLSPYFRFYKYSPTQRFHMHKDGRQTVNGNTTYYTLIVYLNDDCEGGSTKFRQNDIEIKPKAGNALLFQHDLWHQGTAVESGVKYVLRTDVVFERVIF